MKTNHLSCKFILLFLFISSLSVCAQKKLMKLSFESGDSNWHIQGAECWKISDHLVIGNVNDQISYIISNKRYENFELQLEFKCDSSINSGVFIKCEDETMSPDNCLEINIWDLHPNQDFRTGSIVKIQKPLAHVETINKWNTYRIKCKRGKVKVWLNGTLTANYRDKKLGNGYIGLQANGTGEIQFRNVFIRSFKPS